MASRILGFARDMLIAAILGTGPVADAFFVALRLPNLFRRLFGEGAFNAAFVPVDLDHPAPGRHGGRHQLRRGSHRGDGLLARRHDHPGRDFHALAAATCWRPGFAGNHGKFALAVVLTRIMFPYLFFVCLTALFSGVLNAMGRFAAAAAAPVLFNVFSIAFMLRLTPVHAQPRLCAGLGRHRLRRRAACCC